MLVGVSRTAKSTTCFYLAYSGIRAANVPLFADCEPPPELLALDPRRVIGLTMNPSRLQSVREARLRGWKMDLSDVYARSEHIARELRAANEQMASRLGRGYIVQGHRRDRPRSHAALERARNAHHGARAAGCGIAGGRLAGFRRHTLAPLSSLQKQVRARTT